MKGLERQRALLKAAVDAFWLDFQGEGRFFLPSGSELHQQMTGAPSTAVDR